MSREVGAMPPGLVADWKSLGALIEATNARQPVPCRSGHIVPVESWTSDDADHLEVAAEACGFCPVKAACGAYGIAHPKAVGIYGGLTESQRRAAARNITQSERKS